MGVGCGRAKNFSRKNFSRQIVCNGGGLGCTVVEMDYGSLY